MRSRARDRRVRWSLHVRAPPTLPDALVLGRVRLRRLEPHLPRCPKPIQYVGGELNSTVKDWDCAPDGQTVRWALMYPDAYEVGLPNQGVQILYEVLNERDGRSPSAPTRCGPTWRR